MISTNKHRTHFIPNNRTKTLGHYLTILHFITRKKVYLQHNFKFLPIQRKGQFLISNLIFGLPRTLVNNLCFQKLKLHFSFTPFAHHLYLSTTHKLYFIFVYRNCFSCQRLTQLILSCLPRFSLAPIGIYVLTHYIDKSISQAIISVLSELITPKVLHITSAWKALSK